MGFLHRAPIDHTCERPPLHRVGHGDYGAGSRWQCETCGKVYRLERAGDVYMWRLEPGAREYVNWIVRGGEHIETFEG